MMRALCLLAGVAATLSGCVSEERVVATRGILDGLPGAVSNLKVSEPTAAEQGSNSPGVGRWDGILRSFPGYEEPPEDAEPVDALGLRLKRRDGSIILVLRSPAHVMHHVMATLLTKEYDLLYDQIIADGAKAEYRRLRQDPYESVEFLAKHRDDIGALFATFPMADQTPGINMKTVGRNTFRLTAPRLMWPDLRLRSFDVVIEDGRFRLMSIK